MTWHETDYVFDGEFPLIRSALDDRYMDLDDDAVAQIVEATTGLPAEHVEGVFGALKSVGGAIGTALPGVVQGATAGSALGPWGALVGGLAGGGMALAGKQAGAVGATATVAPRPNVPVQANPAALQLAALLSRPELLQAVMSLGLGRAGASHVPVGSTQVPTAALLNLIGTLTSAAAKTQHTIKPSAEAAPDYFLDELGRPMGDPTSAEQRAEALLALLAETELEDCSFDDSAAAAYDLAEIYLAEAWDD